MNCFDKSGVKWARNSKFLEIIIHCSWENSRPGAAPTRSLRTRDLLCSAVRCPHPTRWPRSQWTTATASPASVPRPPSPTLSARKCRPLRTLRPPPKTPMLPIRPKTFWARRPTRPTRRRAASSRERRIASRRLMTSLSVYRSLAHWEAHTGDKKRQPEVKVCS